MAWVREMTYVVLFDNLLKASVVQLNVFRQVVNIRDDVAQVFLQQQEVLICGLMSLRQLSFSRLTQSLDNLVDFLLASLYPPHYFIALQFLKGKHLVQFALEHRDKVLLVVLGPWSAFRLWVLRRGLSFERCLQRSLQVVVGNVVPVKLLDHGRPELLSEPAEMSVGLAPIRRLTGPIADVWLRVGEETTSAYLMVTDSECYPQLKQQLRESQIIKR